MNKTLALLVLSALLSLCILFFTQSVAAGEKIEIIGTVNDNFQIVTDDGDVYNIGDNDKGVELDHYEGKRIEVRGELFELDGDLVIMVEDFEVIDVVSLVLT